MGELEEKITSNIPEDMQWSSVANVPMQLTTCATNTGTYMESLKCCA
jgi:hypothetical protein